MRFCLSAITIFFDNGNRHFNGLYFKPLSAWIKFYKVLQKNSKVETD